MLYELLLSDIKICFCYFFFFIPIVNCKKRTQMGLASEKKIRIFWESLVYSHTTVYILMSEKKASEFLWDFYSLVKLQENCGRRLSVYRTTLSLHLILWYSSISHYLWISPKTSDYTSDCRSQNASENELFQYWWQNST